jgi:hypothetical protein
VRQKERTPRCTNTHDGLEHDGHDEHLSELVRKLDRVFGPAGVERRVEVGLPGGEVRKAGCVRTVSVASETARQSCLQRVAMSWYWALNRNMSTDTCVREHSIAKVL